MSSAIKKLKTMIIINPISGGSQKHDLRVMVSKYLDREQFEVEIVTTAYAGHACALARGASAKGYHMVVAAGGDGLINEIASGLIYSDTIMGIIPTGSGNGLARHLGIPLNPVKAIRILNRFNTVMIDTCSINDEKIFCNMAGVGFDARVAEKFSKSAKRGLTSYVKIIVKEFIRFPSHEYTLNINGNSIRSKAILISFANSRQFGNNAKIAPLASVNDGLMDVCIMKDFPRYKAPYIGLMLLTGGLHKTAVMKYFKTADVRITLPENAACHTDGDPYNPGKVLSIKTNRHSLRIVIPENITI
ncbi:MAG: diacylglycerol kinase family lipid kinase [Bacteroidales bacterium]